MSINLETRSTITHNLLCNHYHHFRVNSVNSLFMSLGTVGENVTRLGMRIQETLSEHIVLGGSNAAILDSTSTGDIRKQLDSSSDRDKLDAMKRLIAVCYL